MYMYCDYRSVWPTQRAMLLMTVRVKLGGHSKGMSNSALSYKAIHLVHINLKI